MNQTIPNLVPATGAAASFTRRWECDCQLSGVLLATYDAGGHVHIKAGDRYYWIEGLVRTVCPRCGTHHELDLSR